MDEARFKAMMDQADIQEAQDELACDCWVIVHHFPDGSLYLTGPYPTPAEALTEINRITAINAELDPNIVAMHGLPTMHVQPVLPD